MTTRFDAAAGIGVTLSQDRACASREKPLTVAENYVTPLENRGHRWRHATVGRKLLRARRRYLLRNAVDAPSAEHDLVRAHARHLAIGKAAFEHLARAVVRALVEQREDDARVREIEVHIRCGEAVARAPPGGSGRRD